MYQDMNDFVWHVHVNLYVEFWRTVFSLLFFYLLLTVRFSFVFVLNPAICFNSCMYVCVFVCVCVYLFVCVHVLLVVRYSVCTFINLNIAVSMNFPFDNIRT